MSYDILHYYHNKDSVFFLLLWKDSYCHITIYLTSIITRIPFFIPAFYGRIPTIVFSYILLLLQRGFTVLFLLLREDSYY